MHNAPLATLLRSSYHTIHPIVFMHLSHPYVYYVPISDMYNVLFPCQPCVLVYIILPSHTIGTLSKNTQWCERSSQSRPNPTRPRSKLPFTYTHTPWWGLDKITERMAYRTCTCLELYSVLLCLEINHFTRILQGFIPNTEATILFLWFQWSSPVRYE